MEKLSRYQEAALVWLERNPGKTLANYKQKTKVELENGDCVPLGIYLNRIRCIYKAMQKGEKFWSYRDLTNEEIQWWSNLGIVWDTLKEINRSYQEAALVWLEKNPGKTLDDCMQGEEIKLENGEVVKLGVYIGRIRRVTYRYMQKEDKHEQCRILTEEEIQWWSEHGLHWNLKHAGKMQKKDTGDYSTITGMKQFTQNIENDVLSSLKEHISGEWIIDLFHRIIKKSNCSGIYTEQELMNFAEELFRKYLLTSSEKKILYEHLKNYLLQMKQLHIYSLAEEKNENRKLAKIQKYGLDELDIEESFFVSFQDQKKLLMKGYIVDWEYYSEEEKAEIQKQNCFSDEDMQYMENTRKQIDCLVSKVKKIS